MTIVTKQLTVLFISIGLLCITSVVFAQEVETETSVSTTNAGEEVSTTGSASARSSVNLIETSEEASSTQDTAAQVPENFASSSASQRTEIETRVADQKIALQARAQARITNLAANMSNKMEAVINRLLNVSNRLESRIEKIQARGINTLEAENALASAQISIDAALLEIATVDADVAAAISSQNARAGWSTVKSKFIVTRDHITISHTELRASVAALKEAVANPQTEQNTEAEFDSNVDVPATEIINN